MTIDAFLVRIVRSISIHVPRIMLTSVINAVMDIVIAFVERVSLGANRMDVTLQL